MLYHYISIGSHNVRIESPSARVLKEIKQKYPCAAKHSKIRASMSISLIENFGTPLKDYQVETILEGDIINYRRDDYLIKVDSKFKEAIIRFHDALALKHALMNLYSSFILHHNWGLLIHSSCVNEHGRAHLFAGQSGAGKSTAAQLSQPRELLSDEASIVKIAPDGITVFNSPFNSELESTCTKSMLPLGSIQLLHQATCNQRIKVKKSDALLQLMDKVFYWGQSPQEAKRILYLLKMMVETVPVYDLHFKKDDTFWELIS